MSEVYTRSDHHISRGNISKNAIKVLYRLKDSGFDAYLVGGCVRDLLLGREPKDFDVVTDAHPDQVRKAFRNSRLIGRRFRLAHVYFGREIIEVATFRGSTESSANNNSSAKDEENGRLLRDNTYGTLEEDVWRRDFTINALYYNIKDFSVVDYVGGMQDLQRGELRLIGDPAIRYREDPVRMLRAARFAAKLGFTMHPDTEAPIRQMAGLLEDIPPPRLFDEALKLFLSGCALQTFEVLRHYGLFAMLFPATEKGLSVEKDGFPKTFLNKALGNTDKRLAEGKTVTTYFLLSALLWDPFETKVSKKIEQGLPETKAYQEAASEIIAQQLKRTAFPRHVGISMREVWSLQTRFKYRQGQKPFKLLTHPKFRAAYDFLLLRAETGGADQDLADWWTRFHLADEHEQTKMSRGPRKRSNRTKRKPKHYRQDIISQPQQTTR